VLRQVASWMKSESTLRSDTDHQSAWIPGGAPSRALMVVPLPQGPEKLDMRRYLDQLSLRLQDLLETQDYSEQAAIDVVREFERAGLAQSENVWTHSSMACAMDLIEDNPNFRTWLSLQRVTPEGELLEPSAEALETLRETTLEDYLESIPMPSMEW
jgi:hypothetical protein